MLFLKEQKGENSVFLSIWDNICTFCFALREKLIPLIAKNVPFDLTDFTRQPVNLWLFCSVF